MNGSMIMEILGHRESEEDERDAMPSGEAEGRAALLPDLFASYRNAHHFEPGQLVEWKPQLCNRKYPEVGEPAIVMEVVPAILDENEKTGSPYWREPLNIKIGVVLHGTLAICHVDSNRLQPYKPAGTI